MEVLHLLEISYSVLNFERMTVKRLAYLLLMIVVLKFLFVSEKPVVCLKKIQDTWPLLRI